jgi:probable rRNA maturation factor
MLSLSVRGRARGQVAAPMRRELRRLLGRAMKAAGVDKTQVCLSLSDDEELHALNQRYADEDHPTDVLSFSQRESRALSVPGAVPAPVLPGIPEPLGDILISVEYAERQAAAQRHDLLSELLHLSVHGLCHLLGYDHATPEEERVMFGYEAALREAARDGSPIRRPIAQPIGQPIGPAGKNERPVHDSK